METTRPLKRHPSLVSFSRDHHDALLLVWKIREGLKRSVEHMRIRDYIVHLFHEDLEPHFLAEEELLFAKMPADDALRSHAESDHAVLRGLAAELKKNADAALLGAFADRLEQHVRFEERALFARMQEVFSAREMDAIAAAMNSREKEACPAWTDEFWKK